MLSYVSGSGAEFGSESLGSTVGGNYPATCAESTVCGFSGGHQPKETRKPGRPRCSATAKQTLALRDQGLSFGQIGKALKISKSSAERLCRAALPLVPSQNSPEPSQNSRGDMAGPIPRARPLIRVTRSKRSP